MWPLPPGSDPPPGSTPPGRRESMKRMDAEGAWHDLELPWRAAFELAWESWCAGSLGIGAVVTDDDGEIVARGRNRIFEDAAPPGQVAGTRLAHAEVNALAQLGYRDGRPLGHAIYTTLEPCLGCSGAIRMSLVGTVHYAAGDPLWTGANELLATNVEVVRHWPRVHGPRADALATLGFLLPLVRILERDPDARFVETYRDTRPAHVGLAEMLVVSRALHQRAEDGASLPDALAPIWDELDATHREHA